MIDAAAFEPLRRYLFAIAYRMLGSASDAEDVVQDAWHPLARRGRPMTSARRRPTCARWSPACASIG